MISNEQKAIQNIKHNLDRSIDLVVQNIGCYSTNPGFSFTRRRKLPPEKLINLLLCYEASSSGTELTHYFSCKDVPSASALYQQRIKLDYEAMERVFSLFLSTCECNKTYKGFRLLAADGSDVGTPYDNSDTETAVTNDGNYRIHNSVHLNAVYDILNDKYIDVIITPSKKSGEVNALIKSVEEHRCPPNSIIIADRGYESYELMAACITNNQKFIIRCKDIESSGVVKPMEYSDTDFDEEMNIILTRKQTNAVKDNPKLYRRIMTNQSFKYLPITEDYYPMNLRVVRFKITEDTYEVLVTNLPEEQFSSEEMKELYHLRWSEEVSFRNLKYPLGMIYLHSKNLNLIKQEIFAKVILYNFISEVRNVLDIVKKSKKYIYKVSFTKCVTTIRMYLSRNAKLRDVIKEIKRSLVPIRPERKYIRNITAKSAKTLAYRIA
ncbi:MAG: IS4 family transposase [Erysipelotrichaceae bacterium]|nr:IS4 family transposase [Erysipelotrichaceae bacterium]